uniref:Nam4 n=1 Tax=Streptomyces sp. LZ35 TaxID=1245024 RepID=A0A068ENG6_9ACTN|nr:Nam4 [Streptomyces sp. LZ35]
MIPADTPGVRVRRVADPMGCRAAGHAEVTLQGVRIPADPARSTDPRRPPARRRRTVQAPPCSPNTSARCRPPAEPPSPSRSWPRRAQGTVMWWPAPTGTPNSWRSSKAAMGCVN